MCVCVCVLYMFVCARAGWAGLGAGARAGRHPEEGQLLIRPPGGKKTVYTSDR